MRTYRLNVRGGAGAIALGIAVVVIGAVVVVSGLALLIGVALIAVLVVGAAMTLRRVFGAPARHSRSRPASGEFDPSLEVFPPEIADARPREGRESQPLPRARDSRGD